MSGTPSPDDAPASGTATGTGDDAPLALLPAIRLAEAVIFASPTPVSPRALARALPEGSDAAAIIDILRARYAGRGIELAEVAGGVQFRTAPDLAAALRKVIEVPRRLTRVAMETLAIVAYHQPVTRPEIEHLRGASLSQQTLDQLLENRLIAPAGRKEAPGRPTLWATTPEFLSAFGLASLKDLPRREDLFVEPPSAAGSRPANDVAPPAPAAHRESGSAEDARPQAGAEAEAEAATPTVPPAPASC